MHIIYYMYDVSYGDGHQEGCTYFYITITYYTGIHIYHLHLFNYPLWVSVTLGIFSSYINH